MMQATAHVSFDREYFDSFYSDWLVHRSRWRRYALPVAIGLTLLGTGLLYLGPQHRVFGVATLLVGLYHIHEALTHRRKWLADRMKDLPDDKVLDVSFFGDHLEMETPNSSTHLRLAALTDVIGTPTGMFLLPQTGVSIYIPRASIEPSDAFSPLVAQLVAVVHQKRKEALEYGA